MTDIIWGGCLFYNCIYLLVFGYAGCSWLHTLSSSRVEQELLSHCSVWASHCNGFSCGVEAHGLQRLQFPDWSTGLILVAHGPICYASCGFFLDQRLNPCLLHWAAKEALLWFVTFIYLCQVLVVASRIFSWGIWTLSHSMWDLVP